MNHRKAIKENQPSNYNQDTQKESDSCFKLLSMYFHTERQGDRTRHAAKNKGNKEEEG